jgi:hypothetical protein
LTEQNGKCQQGDIQSQKHCVLTSNTKNISLYIERSIRCPFWTYSFYGATAPTGPAPPHYRGFTTTLIHSTRGRFPLVE